MQRLFFAVLGFVLATVMTMLPAAAGSSSIKLVNPNVTSGVVSQLKVQVLDPSGKPASGVVVVKSLRVDMGPDKMKDMTTPAKALPGGKGMVVVETNIYAPGRWAVIISGTVDGKPFSGEAVLTATQKKAEAALPPPAPTRHAAKARKILYYRNPMGLADTSPTPKKDGMGMDYIPVYADEVQRSPGTIKLTADKIQHAGVRLSRVTRQSLNRSIRAPGRVAADENRQGVLTARFKGFVEKLYIAQTGDVVRKGQPMMRVWVEDSDVLARIADYVGATSTGAKDRATQTASILRQYAITSGDLAQMARTGQPTRSITITAPMSGTVTDKPVVNGMHFAVGDTLFKTTDISHLWVLADISERDLPLVRVGQTAQVSFRDVPGETFSGKVIQLYPELDATTRTTKARIALANPGGRLRLGQYTDIHINAPIGRTPVLTVPASAMIDDGQRKVVFVALQDGIFEPRAVQTGFRSGDVVEIRSGLREGETIVTAGNFLIDAESNMQAAIHAYQPKGRAK